MGVIETVMCIKRRGGGLEAEKVSVCTLCLVFSQAAAPGQSGEVETGRHPPLGGWS
jgi:hypothetical protein